MIYEKKMTSLYGLIPDHFDYHALMYCYGVQHQVENAEHILQKMDEQYQLKPNVFTNNTLLGCYQRNGDIDKAISFIKQQYEDESSQLDIASYNTVIAMLDQKERYHEALELYDQLPFAPDRYTYSNILHTLTQIKDKSRGNTIYSHLYKILAQHHHLHHQPFHLQSSLKRQRHKKQFNQMYKNPSIDISTINAMLAYQVSVKKDMNEVLDIYYEDLLPLYKKYPYLKPNTITCNIILDGILRINQNAGKASTLYHEMVHVYSFLQPDLTTFGILMDAKGLVGGSNGNSIQIKDIDDALDIYWKAVAALKQTNLKLKNNNAADFESNPLVNRLISSLAMVVSKLTYSTNNTDYDINSTMDHLWQLIITKWQHIILDKKAYNGFLYGFANAGRADLAQELYDRIFRHSKVCDADIVTYTGLMVAYIQSNHVDDAIEIYEVLKNHHFQSSLSSKIRLDSIFFTTVIKAMTNRIYQLSSLNKIEKELDFILDIFMDMRSLRIQPHLHTYTAMLNCCGKAKHAEGLEQVHQLIKMDLNLDPDTGIYNALMDGYNRTDQIDQVLNLWDLMSTTTAITSKCQFTFDAATISIVIDACGHHMEPLRGEAIWSFLNQIQFPLNTNHFNSYIEFLCRVGDSTIKRRKQQNKTINKQYWLLAHKFMVDEKKKNRFFPDEKTRNTFLSFARKYEIDQDVEIQQKLKSI
ncbi:unnamed protein product [Cunninghamella blakesleeana]